MHGRQAIITLLLGLALAGHALAGEEAELSSSSASSSADTAPLRFAFDGYCPVTLVEASRWQRGDETLFVHHHGQCFLFANAEKRERFLRDPKPYEPVAAGQDVIELAWGRSKPGQRRHGLVYKNRIYLFASEANLERFSAAPERFADPSQPVVKQANYVEVEP
jgi:YHS domain-containing protein